MKKKKVNVGGRPRHNKKVKVHKSIRIDPDKLKMVLKEYPDNLSAGLDAILGKWCKNRK
jgi:hypothetical protein